MLISVVIILPQAKYTLTVQVSSGVAAVGTPDMVPVVLLIVRPAGSVFTSISVGVPPVIVHSSETDSPTVKASVR